MPNLMFLRILPFIGAAICLVLAIIFAAMVRKKDRGTSKMVEISNAIFVGSRAYLNQQARIMAIFFVVLEILFGIMVIFGYLEWPSLPAFATGMGFSLLIGYIGMWISTTS
ncbi:MAG: sodium-translocating pyrophosphatase, partial [Actinobacteria bacterium]|nr:sodium-translocating pyrophosphatase [Actinomycetota bacterium]